MLIHLTHLSLIKISGEQAMQFLQGQLTCNLAEIDVQHSRLGAYCDHKGRMFTDFRLYYDGSDYYLLLNKSLIEKIITQLKKFAIFSKVLIEDVSDLFILAGYLPAEGITRPHTVLEKLPSTIDEVIVTENLTTLHITGLSPRYLIIIKKEKFTDLDLHFDLTGKIANERWQLENILAGIPTIYPETSETFTPHMINYHLINGISFNKGCFVGQEIIARTQHLGKLKRHMYRMQIISDKSPKAGDSIFSGQQEVGTVVDASPDLKIKSAYQLLAMIHDEEFTKQGLTLAPKRNDSQDEILIAQSMPYNW